MQHLPCADAGRTGGACSSELCFPPPWGSCDRRRVCTGVLPSTHSSVMRAGFAGPTWRYQTLSSDGPLNTCVVAGAQAARLGEQTWSSKAPRVRTFRPERLRGAVRAEGGAAGPDGHSSTWHRRLRTCRQAGVVGPKPPDIGGHLQQANTSAPGEADQHHRRDHGDDHQEDRGDPSQTSD